MKIEVKNLAHLTNLLQQIEIPVNYDRGRVKKGRHGSSTPSGKGRSVLLGLNPYKKNTLTKFTTKHPILYKEVLGIAHKYVPFHVNKIMLNKNYQTLPHYDSKNTGRSIIFSFGDYTGGELVIEGKVIDTYLKTVEMDGRTQLHWNKPITSGTKYSLIFFS